MSSGQIKPTHESPLADGYKENVVSLAGSHDLAQDSQVLAREDMAAILAHDLRNPLSTVMLAASAIKRAVADEPGLGRVSRQSDIILKAALQMERLISDLADLSKPPAGDASAAARGPELRPLLVGG